MRFLKTCLLFLLFLFIPLTANAEPSINFSISSDNCFTVTLNSSIAEITDTMDKYNVKYTRTALENDKVLIEIYSYGQANGRMLFQNNKLIGASHFVMNLSTDSKDLVKALIVRMLPVGNHPYTYSENTRINGKLGSNLYFVYPDRVFTIIMEEAFGDKGVIAQEEIGGSASSIISKFYPQNLSK